MYSNSRYIPIFSFSLINYSFVEIWYHIKQFCRKFRYPKRQNWEQPAHRYDLKMTSITQDSYYSSTQCYEFWVIWWRLFRGHSDMHVASGFHRLRYLRQFITVKFNLFTTCSKVYVNFKMDIFFQRILLFSLAISTVLPQIVSIKDIWFTLNQKTFI